MNGEEEKKPPFTVSDRRFSAGGREEERPEGEEPPRREEPPRKEPIREEPSGEGPLPEAQFSDLVRFLSNYALLHMVGIKNEMGEVKQDLDQAKLFVDLLGLLREKTKGNLSADEEKLLDSALYQLRMEYVSASEEGVSGS